jgi:hypothetical protein
VGIRCADHATTSTRKSLALTLPTSGGRSIGIARLRTTATEFSFFFLLYYTDVLNLAWAVVRRDRFHKSYTDGVYIYILNLIGHHLYVDINYEG